MAITDEEWATLCSEDVEREIDNLSSALEALARLHHIVGIPPTSSLLATQLVRLQKLATSVFGDKNRHDVEAMFDLADTIRQQTVSMTEVVDNLDAAVFEFVAMRPRSLRLKEESVSS